MSEFHFLYPAWLVGLLSIPLLWIWVLWRRSDQGGWKEWVDPALMPFVLTGQERKNRIWPLIIFSLISALAFLALAGPSWQKREVPVFRQQQALVIALDLSTSMYSQDVSPSRLELARFKLLDLLQARKDAQNALVVFAGDAFIVSPLTDDGRTIDAQMRGLTPDIMPVQGSRADRAILRSIEVLQQSGAQQGAIVLLTDGSSEQVDSQTAADRARKLGYTVSVMGFGTEEGAPIPLPSGGLLTDARGKTVLAPLDTRRLQELAKAGGGLFVEASLQGNELDRLLHFWQEQLPASDLIKDSKRQVDTWVNEGIWLVIALLPFVIFLFRRGWLAGVMLAVIIGSFQPPTVQASVWQDLWKTPDQQGQAALEAGEAAKASQLFQDPDWKAAAAYKAGDYKEAERLYAQSQTLDGLYNYGNALAKQNKIAEAIAAYEKVLAQDPNHADAKHNLELLKKQQEQQQQSQQNQQNNQNQQNGKQQQEQQNQDNASQEQNNQQQDAAEQQAQQERERKQKEQEQQKQQQAEQAKQPEQPPEANDQPAQQQPLDTQAQEQQQAAEQWLRRIPDDPAGLWRRKFQYQYQQRGGVPQGEAW